MLIMPLIAEAMSVLFEVRDENHLSAGNKYFFATNSDNGFLKQSKVLAKIAVAADLSQPLLIRSTKLRKYLATIAQVTTQSHVFLIYYRPGQDVKLHPNRVLISSVIVLLSPVIVSPLLHCCDAAACEVSVRITCRWTISSNDRIIINLHSTPYFC